MNIRLGTISDTEKISQIHKESIDKLCKDCYSPDNIEKWTSILNPEIYENAIKEKILIVAEEGNKICGFGILDIDNAELCAIYIQPNQIKKGIAKNILSKLESIALEKNVRNLSLCSTINALEFYKKQGYIEAGKTFHELSNGVKLNCVKMHKIIKGTK
jgi:putative acetyltransferase